MTPWTSLDIIVKFKMLVGHGNLTAREGPNKGGALLIVKGKKTRQYKPTHDAQMRAQRDAVAEGVVEVTDRRALVLHQWEVATSASIF